MRVGVLLVCVLAGCGNDPGVTTVQAQERVLGLYSYDILRQGPVALIEGRDERGQSLVRVQVGPGGSVSVATELQSLMVRWEEGVAVLTSRGELVGRYEKLEDVGELGDFQDLFFLATAALADPGVAEVALSQDLTVGASTKRQAMITGDEAYWCGVGTAGALIVGGPGSAFLYAVACGMWADMDSW